MYSTMKLFLLIFACLSIFPKYVYSSNGDCEGAIGTLVSESTNLVENIRENPSFSLLYKTFTRGARFKRYQSRMESIFT